MRTDEPAAAGSITDGLKTVGYAKNSEGRVEQIESDGWQPVNEVNLQAWREIGKQVDQARRTVASGRASCLYYHMVANQMGIRLLARYTRQPSWRVLLHLAPFFFRRLDSEQLHRYAALFQVSTEDLAQGTLPPAIPPSSDTHD